MDPAAPSVPSPPPLRGADGGRKRAIRRIVVVGTTGSGKTTLASRLAGLLHVQHVELDSLYWDAHWSHTNDEIFRARISAAIATDGWVADGNYRVARDLIWRQADLLIWLDYPLRINLWRLTSRTLRRVVRKQELWNGNRERFRTQFLSRDSLLVWALKQHRRRRRQFDTLLAQPAHVHLQVVHLFSPRATDRWLRAVQARAGNGNRTRAFSLGS